MLPSFDLAVLLSLSSLPFLTSAAVTNFTSTANCKAFPGSPGWPSASTWDGLNKTLSGRLLSPLPPASVCHRNQTNFSADQCAVVQKDWLSYQWHAENPVSVMRDQLSRYSCLPNPETPCSSSGYPPFVVDASGPEDVKITVDFARKHNIRLIVKNTGHDFFGRSIAPGALSIWTHHLKDITYHPNSFKLSSGKVLSGNAVTVGAGAQMFEIYTETDKHGQTIVGGAGKSVGYTGYMAGGGHSVLAPRFGLAADNVLEIEAVTPAGELITANEDRHSDLFWAMRGGGGLTFGIITKITIRTHPTPKIVGVRWTAEMDVENPRRHEFAADIVSKFPEMSRSGVSGWNFITERIKNPLPAARTLSASSLTGVVGKVIIQNPNDTANMAAEKAFAPVRKVIKEKWEGQAKLLLHTQQYPSFLAWISENYDGSAAGNSSWIVSRLLDERALTADKKALASALEAASRPHHEVLLFMVTSKGAKDARPRGNGTAANPSWSSTYIHAATLGEFEPFNKASEQEMIKNLDESFQPLRDLSPTTGAYVNEGLQFEKDWQHSFWGSNYERLVQIKRRIDPRDVLWCFPCVGNDGWRERPDGRLCRA